MVASYVIVRYVIVKPVKHLRDVSDAIAAGRLTIRSQIETGDEFEELSHAFNPRYNFNQFVIGEGNRWQDYDYFYFQDGSLDGNSAIKRPIVLGASVVWMVEKTTWPVSEALSAMSIASPSRTSPTKITSGSSRSAPLSAVAKSNIKRAMQAGVKIALGTDAAVYPHGLNAHELDVYVNQIGMTPLAALQTATVNAADLLGWSAKTGTLEPGKWADIIAVEKNPVDDVRVLQDVKFVMKAGSVYKNETK